MQYHNLCNHLQTLQKTFLGTPITPTKTVSTTYTPLTVCPSICPKGMQRQELELAGAIGKHSQSQRNYEQNLAEMTLKELSAIIDRCEGEKAALAKDITLV